MITVASAEVAQGISDDSYGLIFGINRFVALTIQTVLTFSVADSNGFALMERDQFLVYGFYFGLLGGLFAIVTLLSCCNCDSKFDKKIGA
jgi:thiamine transporter 2/3